MYQTRSAKMIAGIFVLGLLLGSV